MAESNPTVNEMLPFLDLFQSVNPSQLGKKIDHFLKVVIIYWFFKKKKYLTLFQSQLPGIDSQSVWAHWKVWSTSKSRSCRKGKFLFFYYLGIMYLFDKKEYFTSFSLFFYFQKWSPSSWAYERRREEERLQKTGRTRPKPIQNQNMQVNTWDL